MALVVRITRRTAGATDPVVVRTMRGASGAGDAMDAPRQPEQPLDEQQAERAARAFPNDFERARSAVVRTAAHERRQQAARPPSQSGISRSTATVPRVFQLDGEKVEAEIGKLLVGQITTGVELLDGASRVAYQWADEIKLALAVLVYRLSVWETSQYFGDRLMNTVYRDERLAERLHRATIPIASRTTAPSKALKVLHLVLSLLLPYLFRKVEQFVLERNWAHSGGAEDATNADAPDDARDAAPSMTERIMHALVPRTHRRRAGQLVRYASAGLGAAELLNFLAFLATGKYRTVADRVLGMRLVHGKQRMVRHISLYYMNQALFWQVVLGFASVVLPLLRLGRVWSVVSGFRFRGLWDSSNASSAHAADAEARQHCVFCGLAKSNITLARQLRPCGHTACYYCHAARAQAHDTVSCPVCSCTVTSAVPPPPVPSRPRRDW